MSTFTLIDNIRLLSKTILLKFENNILGNNGKMSKTMELVIFSSV